MLLPLFSTAKVILAGSLNYNKASPASFRVTVTRDLMIYFTDTQVNLFFSIIFNGILWKYSFNILPLYYDPQVETDTFKTDFVIICLGFYSSFFSSST